MVRTILKTTAFVALTVFLGACGDGRSGLEKADGDWVCDVVASMASTEAVVDVRFEQELIHFRAAVDSASKKVFVTQLFMLKGLHTRGGDLTVLSDNKEKLNLFTNDFEATITFIDADTIELVYTVDPVPYILRRKQKAEAESIVGRWMLARTETLVKGRATEHYDADEEGRPHDERLFLCFSKDGRFWSEQGKTSDRAYSYAVNGNIVTMTTDSDSRDSKVEFVGDDILILTTEFSEKNDVRVDILRRTPPAE